jgi:hypothetical protein
VAVLWPEGQIVFIIRTLPNDLIIFRMDTNWTHGMMEKSLNMRVPKNI